LIDDARPVNVALYRALRDDEAAKLAGLPAEAHLPAAQKLLDQLVERAEFLDFLTTPAYELLE
jgi:hypothetical protein